jgi:tetratricopeptide (TPR) repeat protein
MSPLVFPQKKPSMSMQQAIQQTIAHCQAGAWEEAEILYRAIVQAQPSLLQEQHYWLGYIDALIQAGKPRAAASAAATTQPAPSALPAPAPASTPADAAPAVPLPAAPPKSIPSIKVARPPNPCYTAKLPCYPWKMAIGSAHVPSRRQIHELLAHYERARYDEAETLARELTRLFPLHDLGWKVLAAALLAQGRLSESEQVQAQRRLSRHAVRRKNVRPTAAVMPD